MPALIRIALVLALLGAPAFADGTTRVLLADTDPELHRAIKAALAPWKLEVVIDANAPVDAPQTVADARFVVWRKDGDLVVYDRERGKAQHRNAPDGPLDPASAAAAALTVKTLMRLPPPGSVAEASSPPEQDPTAQVVASAPPSESGAELRVQGGLGTRVNGAGFGARVGVAAFLKPTSLPLRLGIAGELGNALDVKDSGFRGTWSDWSVLALASWTVPIGKWEIEPYVGGGLLRSMLDGDEGMTEHHERATLGCVRAGTFVRVRGGRFSAGGSFSFEGTLGTPAYTKTGSGSQFFEVPPFGLSFGVFAAADLGR